MGKDIESILKKAVIKSQDEVNEIIESDHPKVKPIKLVDNGKSREVPYDKITSSASYRTREYVPE